jgi:hypothetical protein
MKAIFLVSIVTFLQSCTDYKTKEITDFSKEQVIIMTDKVRKAGSLELFINGNIQGKIEITLKENFSTNSYPLPDTLSGKIDTLLRGGDWYNDTIFMFIKPLTPVEGNLSVKYVIHSSII